MHRAPPQINSWAKAMSDCWRRNVVASGGVAVPQRELLFGEARYYYASIVVAKARLRTRKNMARTRKFPKLGKG